MLVLTHLSMSCISLFMQTTTKKEREKKGIYTMMIAVTLIYCAVCVCVCVCVYVCVCVCVCFLLVLVPLIHDQMTSCIGTVSQLM